LAGYVPKTLRPIPGIATYDHHHNRGLLNDPQPEGDPMRAILALILCHLATPDAEIASCYGNEHGRNRTATVRLG